MKIRHFISALSLLLSLIFFCACSTGIESTKRITPTRNDRRILQPNVEEQLMDSVKVTPLAGWHTGRPFLITDNRASLIYDITDASGRRIHNDSIKGLRVLYDGIESQTAPDGTTSDVVRFRDPASGKVLRYATRRSGHRTGAMAWNDFPMAIDLALVEQYRQLLSGRHVWTRTGLWYDADGNAVQGLKFKPVTIIDIQPGDNSFPMRVCFSDGTRTSYIPLNMPDPSGYKGSRTFAQLFSLSDPKDLYPAILPEVWELICRGDVREGMTKEECKLSWGTPKDVEHTHNWDNLIDLWSYGDGKFLMFIDDKLDMRSYKHELPARGEKTDEK